MHIGQLSDSEIEGILGGYLLSKEEREWVRIYRESNKTPALQTAVDNVKMLSDSEIEGILGGYLLTKEEREWVRIYRESNKTPALQTAVDNVKILFSLINE